jgi:hypothetical protein
VAIRTPVSSAAAIWAFEVICVQLLASERIPKEMSGMPARAMSAGRSPTVAAALSETSKGEEPRTTG